MNTTIFGEKRNSNMQEMGETREPMARDFWEDAQRLARSYAEKLQRDFWVLGAAKPHVFQKNALVMGWEVVAKRPPKAMVGVMVFKWVHRDQMLRVEKDLSLAYDVPLSEAELSTRSEDFIPTMAEAAKQSGSILVA